LGYFDVVLTPVVVFDILYTEYPMPSSTTTNIRREETMGKFLWLGMVVLAGLLLAATGDAATYDLSGNWTCTFSGPWASGDQGCAVGPDPSSSCTITQTEDSFTLVLSAVCDPAFSCTFAGTVSDATYTGSNSGGLDGGGTATSTIVFTAASMTEASGYGTSQVIYPEWSCTWGFNSVSLSRDDHNPVKYALTVETNGTGSVTLDPDGGLYNAGTTVTLTAVPGTGWKFDSWTGDASGSQNPTDIVMHEDKTVTVLFTQLKGWISGVLHILFGD
jgi:hypothetical protein